MSRNVINPINFSSESIIGNFSILFLCKIFSACLRVKSLVPVMRFSDVITFEIDFSISFSNLKSLLVTIPINLCFLSTIGIPPMLYSFIKFNASRTFASLVKVIGSNIIPDSDLLTFLTFSL